MKHITKTFNIIKKYMWLVLVILAVLVVRWYYTQDGIKTIAVKTLELQDKVVEKTVSASGKVKSQNSAELSFNTTGRIQTIAVKKGDHVKRGQLLASLDAVSLNQSVQTYKDARDIAIRDKELFMDSYEDDKDAIGGSTQYDINIRKYDEKISQAEAAYNAQKSSTRDSYIYAPFDGVVVDVTKEIGENASIGQTVIQIENLNNIIFEVELDQEDYGFVKVGQESIIELDAYNNVDFKGKVSLLPMYANGSSSSNFIVEITIEPNTENTPLIGMTGDVKIITNKTEHEVKALMYDQVLRDDEDKPYVYIVNDNGIIEKQDIEIGLEGDIYTEIKSTFDKQLVTSINDTIEIKEGYKANIVKQ